MKERGLFFMNKLKKVAITLAVATFIISSYKNTLASTGTITATTVRIRSSASTESEILDRGNNGEQVEVIEQNGDWYKVNFKGKEGYIYKDYVKVEENSTSSSEENNTENNSTAENNNTENTSDATNNTEKAMELSDVINNTTDTYILPNYTSTKLSKIEQGTKINIITSMANWAKVELNEQYFWIPKNVLMVEVTQSEIEEQKEEKTEENQTIEEQPSNQEQNQQEESEQENQQQEVAETSQEKAEVTQEVPTEIETEETAAYISSNVASNFRKGPSTATESLAKLARHTKVTIIGESGDWYKVTYNGTVGYISKALVTKGEPPVETSSRSQEEPRTTQTSDIYTESVQAPVQSGSASSAVAVAQQYLGSSYVSGGTSPSTGFDCSGFTQYVYGQCGISISRTSYTQANDGTAISKSELQPGDLLLFHYYWSSSIGHVGIYVGNGQFIHAANSNRGVVYYTINSGYYADNYAGARRL
jgi:cell wall-associated NlpC family hydrolase